MRGEGEIPKGLTFPVDNLLLERVRSSSLDEDLLTWIPKGSLSFHLS